MRRVLMQDFTGVPAIVDLAAMRDAMGTLGGDAGRINPAGPGRAGHRPLGGGRRGRPARRLRAQRRAGVRAQPGALRVPALGPGGLRRPQGDPARHRHLPQVNLEYLARVVFTNDRGQAYPDTLVGTDSHTPMVNGLSVLGWGVGGIEAEAAMLGQPISMLMPKVVGFKLSGELPEGSTATDLVLTVTELLRHRRGGQVRRVLRPRGRQRAGREPGHHRQHVAGVRVDCAIFPIDAETLRYLEFTDARPSWSPWSRRTPRSRACGTTRPPSPYTQTVELDLGTVVPSLAGPRRPQDRVALTDARRGFRAALADMASQPQERPDVPTVHKLREDGPDEASAESFPASDPPAAMAGVTEDANHDERRWAGSSPTRPGPAAAQRAGAGDLEDRHQLRPRPRPRGIAAITSLHQHLQPVGDAGAGLLARNADRGLASKPWVKTSLAPGSKVVMDYYERAGLPVSGSASTWSGSAAPPASATPARWPPRSPRRSTSTTWWWPRCCPATATSRAASTPTAA